MAFNINDLTAYFDNPAVSRFTRSRKHESDCMIGPMIPGNWDLLNFGNSVKGTSAHAMRLSPMLAPNFSDLQLQEHTAVVPLRVIMNNYEEVMNYAENKDGAILPSFSSTEYHRLIYAMSVCGLSLQGSLLDYLRYPIYSDLFNSQFNSSFLSDNPFLYSPSSSYISDVVSQYLDQEGSTFEFKFKYRGQTFSDDLYYYKVPLNFYSWLLVDTFGFEALNQFLRYIEDRRNPQDFDLADFISYFELGTVQSCMKRFQSFVFSLMLRVYLGMDNRFNTVFNDKPRITSLPLRAYLRFHYDWNTNGNFTDRDLLIGNLYEFENAVNLAATGVINSPNSNHSSAISIFKRLLYPQNRLWSYDYFTSLLPTSAVDNSIEIPANSTVLDLAKLTAFQKLVLKLSYSSRYRDVVWNLFKIRPSDARLQQSSCIARKYHNIGIGETLQTSETTVSSVQGNFAGRGYSSGYGDGFHIFCEEPCVLLNLYSFVPLSVYADAIDPLIHVDDIYDFPIPDMDVLGNQPIYTDFLTGNQLDSNNVFGYGRQYQEWLSNYSTVHGSLKTTDKYWDVSRRFETVPALNDEFLRINDSVDFDEIFSVPDSSQAYIKMVYKYSVTRHVHRTVRILV